MKKTIFLMTLTAGSNQLSESSAGRGQEFFQVLVCGFFITFTMLFPGCRDKSSSPPPPDISGVWAGTWEGIDPYAGQVTGNWEAEVSQIASGITGTGTLTGDVDCMEGTAAGSAGANNVVSGTLSRNPCQQNEWTMTALNILERSTSGVWSQPSSGAHGTFTGTQIAKPGGPRISFVNPSAGRPGAIVTVVGTGFDATAAENTLDFNATPAGLLAADSTTFVVRVPQGATTGPVFVTTARGTGMSPRLFSANPSFPGWSVSNTISVDSLPEGVAISPDGRKAFVANKGSGTVSMINTATNQIIVRAASVDPVSVHSIAASPDGRRVYAAGSTGIAVLDAAMINVIDTISVNSGEGPQVNPQGLALSPDGKRLYVSDNRSGGAVTVLDVATKEEITSFSAGTAIPLGIAASPDGQHAYIAMSGSDEIAVFDSVSSSITATIAVGSRPVGVAVTPRGRRVYVSNELGNSVSVIDANVNTVITTIPVGTAPAGIAISPDGAYAYVANRGSNTVSVLSTTSVSVVGTIPVGTGPAGISISPDGKRAYVTNSAANTVSELGGPLTLTIVKGGTGIGTVASVPDGIFCGSACQAQFNSNMFVTLTATSDSSSYFYGWSGCDSVSGNTCYVTMSSNKTCYATFTSYSSNGGGGSSGGGCFIATAAYGSAIDPRVKVLSDFHEKYFTKNSAGRALTDFYHAYAPQIAAFISRHETARWTVRMIMTPVVYAVRYPLTMLLMATIGGVIVDRQRRRVKIRNKSRFENLRGRASDL